MGQGVGHYLRYYAGFRFPLEDMHESPVLLPYQRGEAVVLIPCEGEPALIFSRAAENPARQQTWIRDIRSGASRSLGEERLTGVARLIADVLEDHGIMRGVVGLAGVGFPWQLYERLQSFLGNLRFRECTQQVDRLRLLKSENELAIIRKAAKIADIGVEALLEVAKEGALEYELHQAAEKAMFEAGGDNPWSVIMSGPRAFISYVSPDYTQRKLQSGDMIHADIGTEYAGYHSDIQPVTIIEEPRSQQVALLRTNMKIIRAMIEATRPLATDRDIVRSALVAAKGEPFSDEIRMSLFGHGYGVGVDPPNLTAATLRKRSDELIALRPGMVLCYEPGIFIPGIGGVALEDEVVVTEDGCEVISNCLVQAGNLLAKLQSLK